MHQDLSWEGCCACGRQAHFAPRFCRPCLRQLPDPLLFVSITATQAPRIAHCRLGNSPYLVSLFPCSGSSHHPNRLLHTNGIFLKCNSICVLPHHLKCPDFPPSASNPLPWAMGRPGPSRLIPALCLAPQRPPPPLTLSSPPLPFPAPSISPSSPGSPCQFFRSQLRAGLRQEAFPDPAPQPASHPPPAIVSLSASCSVPLNLTSPSKTHGWGMAHGSRSGSRPRTLPTGYPDQGDHRPHRMRDQRAYLVRSVITLILASACPRGVPSKYTWGLRHDRVSARTDPYNRNPGNQETNAFSLMAHEGSKHLLDQRRSLLAPLFCVSP